MTARIFNINTREEIIQKEDVILSPAEQLIVDMQHKQFPSYEELLTFLNNKYDIRIK
jgi:hypothetical protein